MSDRLHGRVLGHPVVDVDNDLIVQAIERSDELLADASINTSVSFAASYLVLCVLRVEEAMGKPIDFEKLLNFLTQKLALARELRETCQDGTPDEKP